MTEKLNEARDNLKYLSTFTKYFELLYQTNMEIIMNNVPKLMNALRLINNHSNYFNTKEKLSTLFIKVFFINTKLLSISMVIKFKITNQMVTSCKNYLTNYGNEDLRTLPTDILVKRLNVVWKLYNYYKEEYAVIKAKTHQSNNENPINLSEVYIFGKFETLSIRMHKVLKILI